MNTRRARKIFNDLFRSQAKDLERYLLWKVRNREDARELAQEAFLRMLRMDRLEYIRQPEHYLLRVASNLAYEHRLKQSKSRVEFVAEIPGETRATGQSPEETVANCRKIDALQEALKQLSPNVQASLIWHRRDGLTYSEIAERLGVSGNMVKKYLQTGVAHCRATLQDEE